MARACQWLLSVSGPEPSGHPCWCLLSPPLLREGRAWDQGSWLPAVGQHHFLKPQEGDVPSLCSHRRALAFLLASGLLWPCLPDS